MAIDAGTAFVTILPNTSKFTPALQAEAGAGLKATEARLKSFRAAAGIALGAAVVGIAKFGAASVESYRESQQVLAQLQNTIAKTPGYTNDATAAFQAQATALQNLTGYQDEQILSADTALIRFKLTQSQVEQLIPVVLDFARATGTEVPAAAEAIGKALLGNTRALKAVGIEFTATGDRGKDLTRIMDLLKAKVGGASEAFGKTSQGKIDIFRAKLDDLQESVGKALVPLLDTMVSTLGAIVDAFNGLPGPVKSVITVVAALGVAFVAVGVALKVVRTALAGYGLQLGTTTAETVAATTATEAFAAAETTAGAAAAGWLGKLKGLVTMLPLITFNVQELGTQGGKNAKFFDGWVASVKDGSLTLAQLRKNLIASAGSEAAFAEKNGMTVDAMVRMVAAAARQTHAVNKSTDALKVQASQAHDTAVQLDRLANMAHQSADSVVNAWLRVGTAAKHASDNVHTLHQQIVALPSGKQVVITLPGLAAVRADLRSLHSEVNAIAGTYGITYVIHTTGHAPPVQRLAEGGLFRAASGFRFIAGEASYPTPLGTGAEVVTNQGVEPLAASHLERIADFISARLDRGRGAPGGAGPPREIILRARGRDLIATVNAEELWRR